MFSTLIALLVLTAPPGAPPPGAAVTLAAWDTRGDVTVTVQRVSAGPERWRDGAGRIHTAVTITYRDPGGGAFTTTLTWFLRHVKPVLRSETAYPATIVGPPPKSNQEIADGIHRPSDTIYLPDYTKIYGARP